MLAKLHTFSLLGIEAVPVGVEVDASATVMPKTILVGFETSVPLLRQSAFRHTMRPMRSLQINR